MMCLLPNLSSSEWAAWVQAIGSIGAIAGSAYIFWKQRQDAVQLEEDRRRAHQLDRGRTILELVSRASNACTKYREILVDQEKVRKIAAGEEFLDFGNLELLDRSLSSIPMLDVPHRFLLWILLAASNLRQFRENTTFVLQHHREMNDDQFSIFFKALDDCRDGLNGVVGDLTREIETFRTRREGLH
jgi:hypothetical protein